jgi:hypothetical protein
MRIVTRGFGANQMIVTRGYGTSAIVEVVRREVVRLVSYITRVLRLESPL